MGLSVFVDSSFIGSLCFSFSTLFSVVEGADLCSLVSFEDPFLGDRWNGETLEEGCMNGS